MRESMTIYNEEWISGAELLQTFKMIPAYWFKLNKNKLPHRSLRYRDKNGKEKETNPAYPKHKIQEMIWNDELDFTQPVEYKPSMGLKNKRIKV